MPEKIALNPALSNNTPGANETKPMLMAMANCFRYKSPVVLKYTMPKPISTVNSLKIDDKAAPYIPYFGIKIKLDNILIPKPARLVSITVFSFFHASNGENKVVLTYIIIEEIIRYFNMNVVSEYFTPNVVLIIKSE